MRYRYSAAEDGKLVRKAVIYTCDEHGINFADVDGEAVSIIRKLKSAGYDSYIVGGAVRDLILGKKPKDFDIVSSASPGRIKKIFHNSRIIGRRFRLVHVYFTQRIFEVATFRSIKDGHTGNTFGTIEEDVLRRDFTMNALFYDPEQQIVVDYVGGMKDIKNKQVKNIINLSSIFNDDPVRMIRAVKYAAMTGFSIPFNLKMKIQNQSGLLKSISPSRLTEEIFKIINSEKAFAIIDNLDKMGLYYYLQPQASELMRKNAAFKKNYFKTISELKGAQNQKGQAIASLFYDYLDNLQEWNITAIENFKEICRTARDFVRPMNPPRFEIEYAVKKFLSLKGITIKRSPLRPAVQESEEKPVKRRRRRRIKKPSPSAK